MAPTPETTLFFREDQRFRSPWLILFIGAGTLLALGSGLFLLIVQVGLGYALGSRPLSTPAALAVGLVEVAVGGVIWWLFWTAVLQVEVTAKGLFVRYRPFHRRTRQIDLRDVAKIAAVTYRPIRDYGGWGFRIGRNWRCYNVGGDQGVRFDYVDGTHLVIGSQHAEALAAALLRIWPSAELVPQTKEVEAP